MPSNSWTVMPRACATSAARRRFLSPSTGAFVMLFEFVVPSDFVSTSCNAAASITAPAEVADHLVGDRALHQRDREHALLRRLARLADRVGHFVRLAEADAHATVLVTEGDDRVEREPPAALDHLGDAVHVDHALDEF